MNILKSFIFLVIYASAEKPYNSSAARKISVDLLSLISGKSPGYLQKFLEDYTPQIHDHSHKHKYKHKHAHQHRLVVQKNYKEIKHLSATAQFVSHLIYLIGIKVIKKRINIHYKLIVFHTDT